MVVDVVTILQANLHADILQRVTGTEALGNLPLYGAAYRPATRDGQTVLDIWLEALQVGAALPTLPLCLHRGPTLPLRLDETYTRTCQEQRIPT